MKREHTEFSYVPARHDAINIRLEQWAQWVRVSVPRSVHPMFRQYRSHAWQWHMPEVRAQLNTLECHETERAVCKLPDKHRTALRWAYVWPWVPVQAVRRELAVTKADLATLISNGRDMLVNRLREKMLDS